MLLLLLFSWQPVCEVCLNYLLVMFQPRTGTSLDLGSVANFYAATLLSHAPPFLTTTLCPPRGGYPLLPLPYLPC